MLETAVLETEVEDVFEFAFVASLSGSNNRRSTRARATGVTVFAPARLSATSRALAVVPVVMT